MIANLPLLLPGEAISGWLGAVLLENAHASPGEVCHELLGRPTLREGDGYPEGVGHLLTQVLALDRGRSHKVLAENTYLGEVLAFAPQSRRRSTFDAVCDQNQAAIGVHLGLYPRKRQTQLSKRCPACVAEDVSAYGRARWKVEHQPLSTLVCIEHRVALQWISRTSGNISGWMPPGEVSNFSNAVSCISSCKSDSLERCLKLAQITTAFAQYEGTSLCATSIRIALRLKTFELCFRSVRQLSKSNISIADLKAIEVDFRRDRLLSPLLDNGIPRRIIFGPCRSLDLLSIAITTELVFSTWASFTYFHDEVQATIAKIRSDPSNQFKYWERFESLRHIAKHYGVSCEEVWKAMGLQIYRQLSPTAGYSLNQIPTQEVIEKLFRCAYAGQTFREALLCLRICRPAIEKIKTQCPDIELKYSEIRSQANKFRHREAFLANSDTLNGQPLNRLKNVGIPSYSWLLRNDSDWLIEAIPSLWNIKNRA